MTLSTSCPAALGNNYKGFDPPPPVYIDMRNAQWSETNPVPVVIVAKQKMTWKQKAWWCVEHIAFPLAGIAGSWTTAGRE
jgi:hypothetical protein